MFFKTIVEEICNEENINCKFISKNWIIVMEKNGVTKFITGYKFGINNHAIGELLDDKYATYELLKMKDIPVIEHNILYAERNNNYYAEGCNNLAYAKNLLYKYNNDIVIKINDGTCGMNVMHVQNEDELRSQYQRLSEKYFSMSICPFYDIENEYRAIVLNNNVELVYKKVKPVVIGDGNKTVKELLLEFNEVYFKNVKDDNLEKVLEKNEEFEYDWHFNLARGARASLDINDDIMDKLKCLATDTSNKIGLGFGSIDIIKTKDNRFFVMEINSGVMMENFIKQIPNGYMIAKNVYKKAINYYNWSVNQTHK